MTEKTQKTTGKDVLSVFEHLKNHSLVSKGLDYLKKDNDNTAKEQITLTEIPSPTFLEQERGQYFQRRFEDLGLLNVRMDRHGNVFGELPGSGKGPKLVVSSHLDTVFPQETKITAQIKNGRIYAPGIADDGRGLAVLLTLIRAFKESGIRTEGDVVFVATVGEEGLGDLRGVKGLFGDNEDIDGFISIEPGTPGEITYLATGSRRYRVTYKGPGGHSFGDFGLPSAIHALGRAIARISELQVLENPKTTFNVGTIDGGTSVNTISARAGMLLDMRSTSPEELAKLEKEVLSILQEAADTENKRWNKNGITVEIELVGDRPAGGQEVDSVIVQSAIAAAEAMEFEPVLNGASSTDSNVPISLGIPAVTLGGGGEYGGCHTLEEFFDPAGSYKGAQKIFLTILGLAGIQEVSVPLLLKR